MKQCYRLEVYETARVDGATCNPALFQLASFSFRNVNHLRLSKIRVL